MEGDRQVDAGLGCSQFFFLNFAGTDLHSWRLRAEPHTDAPEVGAFHHGDKICAGRDAAHPGWLKLQDQRGWVKESHEGHPVWTEGTALDLDPGTSMTPMLESSTSKTRSGSDGSKESSSSSAHDHVLTESRSVQLGLAHFVGSCHRLGDDQVKQVASSSDIRLSSSKFESVRWFTGQSYKIALAQFQDLSTARESEAIHTEVKRQRWADIEDTDEDDTCEVPTAACILTGDSDTDVPSGNLFLSSEYQHIKNPRCHNRNRDLLQKKSKTRFCRYLALSGSCQFGDACWFDHSEAETKDRDSIQTIRGLELKPGDDDNDDGNGACKSKRVVPNRRKPARNRQLLQRKNKTQLCQYLRDRGCCPFGNSCWFAHSLEELQKSVSV